MSLSRLVRRSSFRVALVFLLCCGLLLIPLTPLLVSGEASVSAAMQERMGHPLPGVPEGELPDLEDVKRKSRRVRPSRPPVPSNIRSPKVPLEPWNGRRVGDPETFGVRGPNGAFELRQVAAGEGGDRSLHSKAHSKPHAKANHARRKARAATPPPVLDDAFIQNFFDWALLRNPSGDEPTYWNDQLRVAYPKGSWSVRLAAVELGKTLFESTEYAARNRDNHWYVYDLYQTYLMRDPDPGGWAFWESCVPANGRENVRRAFEESIEFENLMATITPNGSVSSNPASLITARTDPRNQPGNGMLTRDAVWSVPLLSLPGRAGLDLGLSLSYSSMVWTRSGPYIYFDEDTGFPSPGFRLGFPTLQRPVFNAQTATNSYLLITPGGNRIELRQVGTSNIYEAGDSSYLQLTDNGGTKLVRSTDGTQLNYQEFNNEYRCTQIKDRNGNYITVYYNGLGRITTIIDTLSRTITFNYDGNANLVSITQNWNGGNHQWVSFGWDNRTMQSSFSGVSVVGPANGTVLPVITQVSVNDGSYFQFDYTNSLQVNLIRRRSFDTVQRSLTTFTYETPAGDAPRLLDSRVSASNWTGINGVPEEVITTYSVAGDGACVMTTPDGTVYKEYYGSGWQKGLTTLSEVWSGGVRQKWTTTAWTQDNTSVSYEVNPRPTETNVYDASGNRRRQTIEYHPQFGLPLYVYDYTAGGEIWLRRTDFEYRWEADYINRRIIGLLFQREVYDNTWTMMERMRFQHDWGGEHLQNTAAAATQHDSSYGTGFIVGRGNVVAIHRYDTTDPYNQSKILEQKLGYDINGSVVFTRDALNHQSSISYADSFSDSVNRNTFAYPTTATDADGFSSTVQYNFDFGATTQTQGPPPAGQSQGAIQTMTYNAAGQLERVTTTNNGAYKRFWYGPDYTASYATVNNVADEAYSIQTFDGLGRVVGAASNHPGSDGGYKAQMTIYDQMGRVFKSSNPAEITGYWVPTGDDAAGWLYTQQTYDWNGRPLVTTNPDTTYKTAEYSGCGCAGTSIVTLTDEGTIDGGVAKRRQQKVYSDVLGRTIKTETLNWQGGSVYSSSVNTYNARDQITQVRQYAGPEGSGTFQDTTFSYDGYGRLKTKHVPEQNTGTNTTWTYNADDSINTVADARGAITTFGYAGTNRGLVKTITRTLSGSPTINSSYDYDATGNRISMTDSMGSVSYGYDQLSRMTSESRTFTSGMSGTYTLTYAYNLANQLTSLSIPFRSQSVGYNYDTAGRLSGITGSGFSATWYSPESTQTLTTLGSNIGYRAWGGRKGMTYGNSTSEQTTYNARLQPVTHTLSNMNYTNYSVCCTYPNYSTMSWSYGYFDDGRVEHAWDSTNQWFDRAYKYDHAGRLKEASTFRRARNLAPFPAVNYPDPYFQSITYDAFNHSSRTGKFYTGEPSDAGTYVNNRRTNGGWQYDAQGNTTFDSRYTHTFDAAGAVTQSVSFAMVGGGQFPYQPQVEITQVYNGDGQPIRRDQLARQVQYDEWGEVTDVIVDTQPLYYLRSSVLGGAAVVDFNPFQGDTVNIYANGQRIARDTVNGGVTFEHHNPVTGSSVRSHGHSTYRISNREERDPRGAEIPLSNPYNAFANNYVDLKFGEPLFIEGGDPFNYSSGLTVDGLPVSESQLAHMVDTGAVGAGLYFRGSHLGTVDLSGRGLFGVPTSLSTRIDFWETLDSNNSNQITLATDLEHPDNTIDTATTAHTQNWLGAVILNISFGGNQEQHKPPYGPKGGVVGGGKVPPKTQTPIINPLDPCAGVTFDQLNYNHPTRTHFVERHILDTDPAYADRSKYRFYGGVGSRLAAERDPQQRLEIAKQRVIDLNNVTFTLGGRYQAAPGANIVFVYGFPWGRSPMIDWEFLVGDTGGAGDVLTNVNTLILASDCRTVITSHPGLPKTYNYRGSPPIYRSLRGTFRF